MYRWLRNIHLYLGLFSMPLVLTYGVSSVQMAHGSWFKIKPAIVEMEVAVQPERATDGRALARELMDRYGLRGDLQQVQPTASGFSLRIGRLGTFYQVNYSRKTGKASVRTTVAPFMGMLNRIHHVSGFWHDFTPLNLWGALVGIVSTGLILLGLTGLYLWFHDHEERKVGAVLLALNLAYCVTLMVLMRIA